MAEGEGGAGATGVPLGALPSHPDAQCGHLEGGLCGWSVDGIAAVPPELPATMETPHVRLCVQRRGHEPQAPGRALSSAPLQSAVIHRDLDLDGDLELPCQTQSGEPEPQLKGESKKGLG